ncbi:MAG TPA: ribosome maturation factor RimM [Burkholderiales bacterium]|nr:ribosome maturation factor RimM [Burkholderiales bacterium]
MGRVAGSYGVRGWIKVAPERGGAAGLAQATEWWIGETPYRVEARVHGSSVIAKPQGVEVREEALKLKGMPVSLRREAMGDPGEGHYFHADLIGFEVVNRQGEPLGKVQGFFSNGAQDVMEIAGAGKKHLLPWVAAVVKAVDLPARRIDVEWGADW